MQRYFFLLLTVLICVSTLVWAKPSQKEARSKISHLNQSIHHLKHKIKNTQHQKQQLEDKLKQLDQQIGHINKKLDQTRENLSQVKQTLHKTQKHYQQGQQQLKEQQKHLGKIIQASYQMGRQPYIKLVLNQQDPQTINRYLHYARNLSQYQIKWFKKIQKTLEQLQAAKDKLAQKHDHLKSLQKQQHEHQQKLRHRKHKRQHIINHLDHILEQSQQRLSNVKANKAQLQKVLNKASRQNHYHVKGKHFYQTKGHLTWPLNSRHITQTYGEPKLNGRVKSSGIQVRADNGQPIHAIFHGQVVFAHWLRGYGLMVVIQHGPHYMTLYAHAQSLYVHKGEKVDPGDIIATVGQSGGLNQSALYFEIRHNGHAVDPLNWLKT